MDADNLTKGNMGKIVNHNIVFGTVGTLVTFIASHFDYAVACACGTVTLAILCVRFRKEWKHRND